jgi:pyruvate/2-oxoglutarate dehydrogenase complex dihydrolipoamide acyltransferase (E2) component
LPTSAGSGPNGRVKPEDVRAAASPPARRRACRSRPGLPRPRPRPPPRPAPRPAAAAVPSVPAAPAAAPAKPLPAFAAIAGDRAVERIPFRGIRRKTSEAMARSKRTAAHFSLIEEVDCTELVAARERAKKAAEPYGVKITFMPYIMKATAIALQEFPQLNAELDEEKQEIIQKKYVRPSASRWTRRTGWSCRSSRTRTSRACCNSPPT